MSKERSALMTAFSALLILATVLPARRASGALAAGGQRCDRCAGLDRSEPGRHKGLCDRFERGTTAGVRLVSRGKGRGDSSNG